MVLMKPIVIAKMITKDIIPPATVLYSDYELCRSICDEQNKSASERRFISFLKVIELDINLEKILLELKKKYIMFHWNLIQQG